MGPMNISRPIRLAAAVLLCAAALHPARARASTQPVETVNKTCVFLCSIQATDCAVQGNSPEFCSGMMAGCLFGCRIS